MVIVIENEIGDPSSNPRQGCPGDNTPRDTNYTDTCPPSKKLYKLDEPDTRDTARTSS